MTAFSRRQGRVVLLQQNVDVPAVAWAPGLISVYNIIVTRCFGALCEISSYYHTPQAIASTF